MPEDLLVACFNNGYYLNDFGVVNAGCDIDSFCKTLAKSSVALAEGRSAKSVVFPMKI